MAEGERAARTEATSDADNTTTTDATTNDANADKTDASKAATDTSGQQERERVAQVLSTEIERIDSPEAADAVAGKLEAFAGTALAGQKADTVARSPETADQAVQAAAQAPGTDGTAAALTEAAAQVVAPTRESPIVAQAVADVLPPRDAVAPPQTERGRRLLREALLRRMKPLQKMDTRLFLMVNCLSHPPATDAIADTITVVTTGGWIWLVGLVVARMFRVRKSERALQIAIPTILGATWFVERPVKMLFRRRRPFIDIVRALVVGRRPDGRSFPSGHSAAAFAGAWILTTVWPRKAPLFFAFAATVGLSRIYVGAHYPGDVITGATVGAVTAEAIRRPVRTFLRRFQ